MLVTLDGQRLDADMGEAVLLQDLIERVRAEHCPRGLIVGVRMNGEALKDAELADALARPVAPTAQVDLESGNPRTLASGALHEAAGALHECAGELVEIAEALQSGRAAEALRRLGSALRTWQLCQGVLSECRALLGEELVARVVNGQTIDGHLGELVTRLREVRDAFDAKDLVLLADLVRYEFPALCETWRDVLNELAAQIEDSAASG